MTPLRCAVLDDYQQVALSMADWSPLTGSVDVVAFDEHLDGDDAVAEALAGFEIVVAMRERTPFPASLLGRLDELRLLVTTGMRNASIDIAAAADRGVTVCGTRSSSEPPTELTWALLLAVARHVVTESTALRAGGPWQSTVGADLHGATLGVLGLGKIGSRVARIGQAFGMDVVAWSQNLDDARAAEVGVRRAASKEELLDQADVVTVHLALSDRTRGLLGADELRRMKPSALLVNTSRGPIVERDALVRALTEGWIAGAGVDVFETEPLPPGDELRTVPNLVATPHLGYVTAANYRRYFGDAVEDIQAFLAGSPVRVLS